MSEVQIEKVRNKKGIVWLIVIIGLIIVVLFPTIKELYTKSNIQRTKEETTVTKTLTKDEIYQLERQQRKLAKQYEKDYTWIYYEIRDASPKIEFSYDFMYDHPEYDSIKIKFPVTSYKVNGDIVKFISNEGKIIQVHSAKGWQDL